MPRLRAVARLGVAADRCRCLSATHPYIVGDGLDQSAEHVVASQAEYEVDAILITPLHHLGAPVMAVTANGDVASAPGSPVAVVADDRVSPVLMGSCRAAAAPPLAERSQCHRCGWAGSSAHRNAR